MLQGVDYASIDENKPPDVLKARTAGVRFAIVRGSFAGHVDPHMARDRQAWSHSNSPTPVAGAFGAYMYLGWGKDDPSPEDQARVFIGAYGRRRIGELPPVLDVEFPGAGRVATGLSAEAALERIERAHSVLEAYYNVVGIYTSARVWSEDLNNLHSQMGERTFLWIKTPYVYKAGNKPHPEACPVDVGALPPPWQGVCSPGMWIHQYQGDARGYPGFTSTVDCNRFATRDGRIDAWVLRRLAYYNCSDIMQFQRMIGLVVDGLVGPATFAYLTA